MASPQTKRWSASNSFTFNLNSRLGSSVDLSFIFSPKTMFPSIDTTVEFQRGKSFALVNNAQIILLSAWMSMLTAVSRLKVFL